MPVAALGAGVQGIGSIIGGILGSNAASQAAKQQQQAAQQIAGMAQGAATGAQNNVYGALTDANSRTNTANGILSNSYAGEQANLNPYLAAGQQGLNLYSSTLQQMMAPGGALTTTFAPPNPNDVANTPEYQFALQQGTNATQQSAAARGLLQSGATLKELTNYGQGLASQQYQNAYGNAANTFNINRTAALNSLQPLMSLTGVGQNAANQYNQAAQNYSGTVNANLNNLSSMGLQGAEYNGNTGLQAAQIAGQAIAGGANAGAAGTIGSANAWGNAIGGVGNALTNYGTLSQMMGPSSMNLFPTGLSSGVNPAATSTLNGLMSPSYYSNPGAPPPTSYGGSGYGGFPSPWGS